MELFILFLLSYLAFGIWTAGYIPQRISNRMQQLIVIKSALDTQIHFYQSLNISEEEKDMKERQRQGIEKELSFHKEIQSQLHTDSFLFKSIFLWFVYLPKFLVIKH